MDLIDEVSNALDGVLIDMIEEQKKRARDKTRESLAQLTSISSVIGFDGLPPKGMPSFTSLQISGLEIYSDLFQSSPIIVPQHPTGLPTVFDIVRYKLAGLPVVSPLSNCLVKQVVQRPRFRPIGIDFFIKVNNSLKEWMES